MTVVKSEQDNIFGGFKGMDILFWSTSDKEAFVYSLIDKENNPFKVLIANNDGNVVLNMAEWILILVLIKRDHLIFVIYVKTGTIKTEQIEQDLF